MRRLGLECIGPYKYLLALHSRTIEMIGYIKNLSIYFNKPPNVSMIIHMVIENILEAFWYDFEERVVHQSQTRLLLH
jgi:hypothetical protein